MRSVFDWNPAKQSKQAIWIVGERTVNTKVVVCIRYSKGYL